MTKFAVAVPYYFALTRAKKRVFIITVKGKESKFASEKYLSRQMADMIDLNLEKQVPVLDAGVGSNPR